MRDLATVFDRTIEMMGKSLEEIKTVANKEVVDATAGKKGICIDRLKNFFSYPISILGTELSEDEEAVVREFLEEGDILVCAGKDRKFFISVKDVKAVGNRMILLNSSISEPEAENTDRHRAETQRKIDRLVMKVQKIPGAKPSSDSSRKESEVEVIDEMDFDEDKSKKGILGKLMRD